MFPLFKSNMLLFCGSGLATSCCLNPDDIEGWDEFGFLPEGYHIHQNELAMIGALCPVNDCAGGGNLLDREGYGGVVVYPVGLTEEQMRVSCTDGTYYINPLLGPYDEMIHAIGVAIAHHETLTAYVKNCACGYGTNDACDEDKIGWWDEGGQFWDRMTCGWGSGAGPGEGDPAMRLEASWATSDNDLGISVELMVKVVGGAWVSYGTSGTLDLILHPCDMVKFGGSCPDGIPPGSSPSDFVVASGTISTLNKGEDGCTDELQAAFAAIPNHSYAMNIKRMAGELPTRLA